jgi:hypothetical protein
MKIGAVLLTIVGAMIVPAPAQAQTVPAPPPPVSATPTHSPAPPTPGSRIWVVAGAGFSSARAGCPTCDSEGVFYQSRSVLVDGGLRVNSKVDAGIEMYWVSTKVEQEEPIRTTFVLALVQLRPWHQRGFFVRAGVGVGFVGNGILNPKLPDKLKKPYTTNSLGVVYGAGWIFSPYRRVAVQIQGTHHVAALGELTTVTNSIVKNVVGNYWTIGTAIVIR